MINANRYSISSRIQSLELPFLRGRQPSNVDTQNAWSLAARRQFGIKVGLGSSKGTQRSFFASFLGMRSAILLYDCVRCELNGKAALPLCKVGSSAALPCAGGTGSFGWVTPEVCFTPLQSGQQLAANCNNKRAKR